MVTGPVFNSNGSTNDFSYTYYKNNRIVLINGEGTVNSLTTGTSNISGLMIYSYDGFPIPLFSGPQFGISQHNGDCFCARILKACYQSYNDAIPSQLKSNISQDAYCLFAYYNEPAKIVNGRIDISLMYFRA